jgi:hypothetical protein
VSRQILKRIRNAVRLGKYDLTHHAIDEMVEDDLGIRDVEQAILNGDLVKTEIYDPRGPKYTVMGLAEDRETEVGIVGRFTDPDNYLIITIYEVTE